MSDEKYPEAIVESVAKALFAGYGSNGYHLDAHYRTEAVSVLDALGLTVGEEWGVRSDGEDWVEVYLSEAWAREDCYPNQGDALVRSFRINAQTPWAEVES